VAHGLEASLQLAVCQLLCSPKSFAELGRRCRRVGFVAEENLSQSRKPQIRNLVANASRTKNQLTQQILSPFLATGHSGFSSHCEPRTVSVIQNADGAEAMNREQKVLTKVAVWLAGEILLSLIGLDTIAAYSEFLSGHAFEPQLTQPTSISLCIG
jgi:hypothetical protein